MKVFIFTFRCRRATIKNKNGDFISLIFFEIVNALNIDEIRNDFNLKREKEIVLVFFFLDITNLNIVFL